MGDDRKQLVTKMTEQEIQQMEQSKRNVGVPRHQRPFQNSSESVQGSQQPVNQQMYFPVMPISSKDFRNMINQNIKNERAIQLLQQKYEESRQEIAYLKAGDLGTDWEIYQDSIKHQIWIATKKNRFKLADAIITTVLLYSIKQLKETKHMFFITFQLSSSNKIKTLIFSGKELDSPTIFIRKLESNGIYLMLKQNTALKHTLLKRQVLETLENVGYFYSLPYYAGWNKQTYEYANKSGSMQFMECGITSPYLNRYFYDGDFEDSMVLKYLYSIFDFLGTELTMLILAISTGAILCSLMKHLKLSINVLFLLDTQVENIAIVQALLQMWDSMFCTRLSNKKKLQSALVESKDEVILLFDEGSKYELGTVTMLQRLVKDGLILAEEGTIVDFQAIPVLLTNREKTWQKECDCILRIPFYGKEGNISIDRGMISCFYHHFCDWLNNMTTSGNRIKMQYAPNYGGKLFTTTFNWLTGSYNVLQRYFQYLSINKNYYIAPNKFAEYINQWLINTEKMQDMDLAEEFIFGMKQLKNKNSLMFVTSFYSQTKFKNRYIVSIDYEFIYIFPNTFSCIVNCLLPGCSSAEVYRALIEEGSAKEGDGKHLFPKCSVKTSDKRERMAKINRNLILSDAEYLLEV